jgi:hypothetical protein
MMNFVVEPCQNLFEEGICDIYTTEREEIAHANVAGILWKR